MVKFAGSIGLLPSLFSEQVLKSHGAYLVFKVINIINWGKLLGRHLNNLSGRTQDLGPKTNVELYGRTEPCRERGLQKFILALSKEKIMKLPLKNIVWKEGNFYVAQCLNVEVSSFGDTKEDALKNLQEALDLYFEDMPVEDALTIENVEIVSKEMEHA